MSIYYKICIGCNLSKPSTEFYKHISHKDNLSSKCKCCSRTDVKKYRENNPEKIKESKKKYRENNIESLRVKERQRRAKRTEEEIQKNNIYLKSYHKKHSVIRKERERAKKEIYQNSEEYKIKQIIKEEKIILRKFASGVRSLIGGSFRCKSLKKNSKTVDILGCSISEFRLYIESKFVVGMSWENRNEWHLDHIVPVSWGQDIDQIIELNHYTNFQPKWAKENISKNNKYVG